MTSGIRVVRLACVGCGANLDITSQMDRLACGHCGASQVVERSGGAIHLRGVAEAISRVQVGTDKTAAELALARLTKEYEAVQQYTARRRAELTFMRSQSVEYAKREIQQKRDAAVLRGVISAFLALVPLGFIASLIYQPVARASSDLAGFVALFIVAVGSVSTGYLMRNLVMRSDNYNPEKFRRDHNAKIAAFDRQMSEELSGHDLKLKQLHAKIQENYRVANS